MEPIVFLVFTVMFWAASVVCVVVAFSVFKRKVLRNNMLIIGLIIFLIPCVLMLSIKTRNKVKKSRFTGDYISKDASFPTVRVRVSEDETFNISLDGCSFSRINGTWEYISDYDGFIFHTENAAPRVAIKEDYQGKVFLSSEILSACYRIDYLELSKVE